MRFFVESYGCTMNYGEGDELRGKMMSLGHVPADSAEDADVVVLNTCTVVGTTETRMIGRISELKGQRKEIIVTGCMAKAQVPRVRVRLPDSLIIAPEDYDKFRSSVEERYGSAAPGTRMIAGATAILPIAQGCLGNCSYCITKKARGDLRSYDPDVLEKRFGEMIRDGAKEILVTAQDTACYGMDIGTDLPSLLDRFLRTAGEYRIRIGMMNPDSLSGITDRLIDTLSDDRIYRFFHVPVQSGSDDVLRRMNRRYTAEGFISLIRKIRARCPDVSISTDMISGFPGETDEDHERSISLLRKLGADTVNVTRFSARPDTPAFAMDGQIHGRTSKERSREITATKSDEALERNRRMIGKRYRVLVTETGKDGTVIARTGNYRPVAISEKLGIGEFIDIEVTGAESTHLFGRTLN
jgi:MiaB-like tRNA modifying enzyme